MSQSNKKKKFHIDRELRLLVYVWCFVVSLTFLLSATYAWYSVSTRVANTVTPNVMKPYHLELQNSQGIASKQISIGSLQQGEVKQIVFSVTNKENPQINQNKTAFEYALELIYTSNMALDFKVYPLSAVDVPAEGTLITQEVVQVQQDGETVEQIRTSYWAKGNTPLTGQEVSGTRHTQVGITGDEINSGTYISYENKDSNGNVINENIKLDAGEDAYATQFYVLEISWSIQSGFEKYNKETDMIYVVAKAVQPEPTVNQ